MEVTSIQKNAPSLLIAVKSAAETKRLPMRWLRTKWVMSGSADTSCGQHGSSRKSLGGTCYTHLQTRESIYGWRRDIQERILGLRLWTRMPVSQRANCRRLVSY